MQTSVVSPQKLAVLALAIVLLLVSASVLAQSIDIDTLCDGRVKLDWGDGPGHIYFDRGDRKRARIG